VKFDRMGMDSPIGTEQEVLRKYRRFVRLLLIKDLRLSCTVFS